MGEARTLKDIEILAVSLVDVPPHPACVIRIIDSERGPSPMLETTQYVRKPFNIDAVQVTAENMAEVAKWVDGEIRTDTLGQYVKVRVHRPLNDRQTKAYVGDHVLYAGTGYKVYTDKAFKNSFDQVSGESVMVDTDNLPKRVENTVSNDEVQAVVEGDVVVPKRVAKKAAKAS